MAPKKKDDKKKADAGPDPGELAATAFAKKNYAASSAQFEVEPLPLVLDRGEEGAAAFLHLAVHPNLSPDPKHMCSPKHVRALMHALGEYAFLQRLAFWSVAVKDEGCVSIASYLVSNRSLTSLDLTDVGISVPGCKALGEALEKNATLQVLRLDHNASIGVRGVTILGDSLTRNLGLSTLSLTYCLLEGADAAEAIVSGVMRSPAIRVLELKGNRLGVDGVMVILKVGAFVPAALVPIYFRPSVPYSCFQLLHPISPYLLLLSPISPYLRLPLPPFDEMLTLCLLCFFAPGAAHVRVALPNRPGRHRMGHAP